MFIHWILITKMVFFLKRGKLKLDSVEEGGNRYTYPITHPATMIEEDPTHRFVSYEELPMMEYEPSEIEIIQERITILEGKLEEIQ